jgi:hypothetical protein
MQSMVAISSAPRVARNLPAFRERLGSYAMNRLLSVALPLLAVTTWPSEGWSRTTRHACDVHRWVIERLDNWKNQLARSTPRDPTPIVGTYDFRRAVLLPTCANGPLTNQSKPETITDYFKGFLKDAPVVEFDKPIVGGVCGDAFASGLYSFKLEWRQRPEIASPLYLCLSGTAGSDHAAPLLAGAKDAKPAVRRPSRLTAPKRTRSVRATRAPASRFPKSA